MIDPDTSKSKGFGFVEYETEPAVLCALRVLQDTKVRSAESRFLSSLAIIIRFASQQDMFLFFCQACMSNVHILMLGLAIISSSQLYMQRCRMLCHTCSSMRDSSVVGWYMFNILVIFFYSHGLADFSLTCCIFIIIIIKVIHPP